MTANKNTATVNKNDEVDVAQVQRHESVMEDSEEGKSPAVDYSGAVVKMTAAEKKLVRKLDLWIMPTLWAMYWLNFLDRNAIALARLDGLEKELGLTGSQYATCVSILFVGYILAQVPSSKCSLVRFLFFIKREKHVERNDIDVFVFRHAPHPYPYLVVHGRLHDALGHRQYSHRYHP